MHQLIYVSEARPGLGSAEVFRIIEQSARNNPCAEITGFLILADDRFLQLIEGPLLALETLIATLRSDPRHHSLEILSRRPVNERSFPRWRMKRVGEGQDAVGELRAALAEQRQGAILPAEVVAFVEQSAAPPLNSAAA